MKSALQTSVHPHRLSMEVCTNAEALQLAHP
jgi:hypothetical protein